MTPSMRLGPRRRLWITAALALEIDQGVNARAAEDLHDLLVGDASLRARAAQHLLGIA